MDAGHRHLYWDRLEPAFERLRDEPAFRRSSERMTAAIAAMRERVADERWHRLDGVTPRLSPALGLL